jgi:hypothetical protein
MLATAQLAFPVLYVKKSMKLLLLSSSTPIGYNSEPYHSFKTLMNYSFDIKTPAAR